MKQNKQSIYDIHFNRQSGLPPLNDADIPPFDDVVKAQKIWLRKTRMQMVIRYSLSCVAVIGIALVVWTYFNYSKQSLPVMAANVLPVKDSSVIKAPVQEWDIPYQSFTIQADSLSVITMPSGTSLTIQPNTLTDSAGQLVKGEVNIQCREFFDPIDIMVAGIPMQYDSAGVSYTLETAGMIEVKGLQNNRQLKIAEGQSIAIAQASRGDNTYNTYSLDTRTGQWKYEGRPEIAIPASQIQMASPPPAPVTETENIAVSEKIRPSEMAVIQAEKSKVITPKLHDESNRSFSLDVDPALFPELAIYKDVLFEIKPGQNFTSTNEDWDMIELKAGKNANEYRVFLHDGGKTLSALVTPVFREGEDYEKALKKFKSFEKEELNKIAEQRKADAQNEKMALAENRKMLAQMREQEKARIDEEKRLNRENRRLKVAPVNAAVLRLYPNNLDYGSVMRTFTISQFGYWNSDRPYQFQNAQAMTVRVNIKGYDMALDNFYQIEKGTNTLMVNYRFGKNSYNIRYDVLKENAWFSVIPGTKKIAILKSDDFKQQANAGNGQINMQVVNREFENAEELKAWVISEVN